MRLDLLYPAYGSKHRKKLLGRGRGTGHGGSSTRGGKGQTARSGEKERPGFEGGQMPLLRRIPKRGFSNSRFCEEYSIVNLGTLEKEFNSDTEINPEILYQRKLIKTNKLPVKILSDGTLTKKFTIKAHAFSKNAIKKIESVGGTVIKI